jgi:hypothetical protein
MDYNINFNTVTKNLLPVSKRKTIFQALFDVLFANTIQSWNFIWANNYLLGTDISNAWNSGSTYNANDIVVGADNQVYQSLVASNTNHNPVSTTGYWWLVETNFVGVYERIAYNAQILTFEYALNKWFRTTFRQPTGVPDIYIVNNAVTPHVFVVGASHTNSAQTYYYDFANFQYVINAYSFSQYDFTIFIPVAVWTALGSNATDRNNKVRSFADKYNVIGNQYNITTY